MTYRLDFETTAINAAAGFLADDPVGLQAVLAAIDGLTEDPMPAEATLFGSTGMRRLRVGRYRVLYRLTEGAIVVIRMGRGA